MKKLKQLFFIFTVLGLPLSCVEEDKVQPDEPAVGVESFEATREQFKMDASETETPLLWDAGDSVALFAETNGYKVKVKSVKENGASAVFEAKVSKSNEYYGVFPYQKEASVNEAGLFTAYLSPRQSAVEGSCADSLLLSVARTADNTMEFKNIVSLISFKVNAADIKAIRLAASEKERLAGKAKIEYNDGNPRAVVSAGENYVELAGEIVAGKTYCLAIYSGEYAEGLVLSFYNSDNKKLDFNLEKPASFTRGTRYHLGEYTITEEDWNPVPPGPQSYVINGLSELESFVSQKPEEKETVVDLTIKGEDINDAAIAKIKDRVGVVSGNVTWDNLGVENTTGFFEFIDCQGSVIIKNCPKLGNPNGFDGYTKVGGDFWIENCPNLNTPGSDGWDTHGWANLVTVEGTFHLSGIRQKMGANNTFPNLKTVGKNFEIIDCGGAFWNFEGMPLESIGGDLIVTDNPSLENLSGLDKLTRIGGNVTVFDNPKVPVTSDWAVGYCIFREYKDKGVISADATFRLGTVDNVIDISSVPTCQRIPAEPQSYVISGLSELESFVSLKPEKKETVINLTITGLDIDNNAIAKIKDRVGVVTGDVTWENLGVETTNGFFDEIDCQGGIMIKNCPELGNPNGFEGYTKVGGDFWIENCPKLATPGSPGWAGHGWANLVTVEGTFHLSGIRQQMGAKDTFPNIKTVGKNFEIIDCGGAFWDFVGMPLESIGGDLIVTDNPSLENLSGLDKLTRIGGNVTVFDNPKVPVTSDRAVGYCIFRDYKEKGIISSNATFRLGTVDNVIDILSVPTCQRVPTEPQSYVINGLSELNSFVSLKPEKKETVINLTITGLDIDNNAIAKIKDRVGVVTGNVTWENVGVENTTDFFSSIDCQGGIIIKNCPELGNPNGFEGYTKVGGDFWIENCPKLATPGSPGWDHHGWANLVTVEGTFHLSGIRSQMGAMNTFPNLKTVGKNFEIIDCGGAFWNFEGMPLESIGGDLIVTDNPSLENLSGLDKLTRIGGNVTVFDNPKVPVTSDWAVGYCIFREYLNSGVIFQGAAVRLGTSEYPVNIEDVPVCK